MLELSDMLLKYITINMSYPSCTNGRIVHAHVFYLKLWHHHLTSICNIISTGGFLVVTVDGSPEFRETISSRYQTSEVIMHPL